MIKAIAEIGSRIQASGGGKREFLESIVTDIPLKEDIKESERPHVIAVNFDTARGEIRFEDEGEVDKNSPGDYLLLPPGGPRADKIFSSTTSLSYIVTQTIPALARHMEKCPIESRDVENLIQILKDVLENDDFDFYMTTEELQKEEFWYNKFLNCHRVAGLSENSRDSIEKMLCGYRRDDDSKAKKLVQDVAKEYFKGLEILEGLEKNRGNLYTVKINGSLICNEPGYQEMCVDYF